MKKGKVVFEQSRACLIKEKDRWISRHLHTNGESFALVCRYTIRRVDPNGPIGDVLQS